MAKFSGKIAQPAVSSAVKSNTPTPDAVTHEGAPAYTREAKSELFLRALTSMGREDSFYESASTRDNSLTFLTTSVTVHDPEWMQAFLPWLRKEGFMRTSPVMIAAAYVRAGGPNGRAVVNSVLQRADEPAEILAFWMQTYGRNIPQPLKRGVADAVRRLYTESAVLKYDGGNRAWRFGDVIELVHPKPRDEAQSALFRFCLDRRRHGNAVNVEALPIIGKIMAMEAIPEDQRRAKLNDLTGMTWERLSGWLPGGMDAEAWEAVIPQMGYMALLRNLRNFDEAKINKTVAGSVARYLADPDWVAKSMQFPFRFYSAWAASTGLVWASALEEALELSVQNIPELGGRSLVIVDTSSSMTSRYSSRSSIDPLTAATLFGAAVYQRNPGNVDLIWATTNSGPIPWAGSILRTIDAVRASVRPEGTYLGKAVEKYYDGHERVFLFTDGQTHDRLPDIRAPYYVFNLNAYGTTPVAAGQGKDHELGGLSDATFKLIPMLESQKAGVWPWEV